MGPRGSLCRVNVGVGADVDSKIFRVTREFFEKMYRDEQTIIPTMEGLSNVQPSELPLHTLPMAFRIFPDHFRRLMGEELYRKVVEDKTVESRRDEIDGNGRRWVKDGVG